MREKDRVKPTAIIVSDIHLRITPPECRTDDYWAAQAKKISFLKEMQEKYECPILDAGDIFQQWNATPYLEQWAIRHLPKLITVPGNHELPGHNINLLEKSSLAVLEAAGTVTILSQSIYPWLLVSPPSTSIKIEIFGFAWGEKIQTHFPNAETTHVTRKVALAHFLAYQNKSLWPGMVATKAKALLKANPEFDLIITGHNHWPFVEEYQGRLLVNPGCILRQHADQGEMKPRVYLWFAEQNKVRPIYMPFDDDPNVISRSHLEGKNHRDERLEAYVRRMKDQYEVGLSFEKNMEAYLSKNKIRRGVTEMIGRAIG